MTRSLLMRQKLSLPVRWKALEIATALEGEMKECVVSVMRIEMGSGLRNMGWCFGAGCEYM